MSSNMVALSYSACVRGSPVVPLVGNICTICTNLIADGTIGKEFGANGKMVIALVPMVQMLPTNGTIGRTPNTRNVGIKVAHTIDRIANKITAYK